MRARALLAAGAAALAALGGSQAVASTGSAAAAGSPSAAVTPAEATALGEQAYLYGFPLLEFVRVQNTETSVRCPDHVGDAPLNSFSNANQFANPSERTIVAPNVDTLYSIAHLDLGRGPVVLSHPDMGHRYFVFELLDPYTNVIGYVGSRTTGSAAGRFEIAWTGHPGRRVSGTRLIRSRYKNVWIVGRTLVDGGRADLRKSLALMARYRLSPPGGPRTFRPGCTARVHTFTTPSGLAFLTELDRAMRAYPPPARDRPLLAQLATVGVGAGLNVERAGLSPAALQALVSSVDATATSLPGISKAKILTEALADHGWANIGDDIGDYGTDYLFRAEVAELGLGANTRQEAIYPTALTDADGQFLNGSTDYELVFKRSQAPPVRAFWSLTMYDASGYLVSNPEHRYAVGNDHPPLRREPDGSIVVLIQRTKPDQPDVNWLPAPSGDFRLNLRLYWPKRSALDGSWQPPPVQPISG